MLLPSCAPILNLRNIHTECLLLLDFLKYDTFKTPIVFKTPVVFLREGVVITYLFVLSLCRLVREVPGRGGGADGEGQQREKS